MSNVTISIDENNSFNWLDKCFDLMDQANADSKGQKWTREDLYDA